MAQAERMWTLRVKIDVWSQALDESLRERNRVLLMDSYLRLPPSRVWLFMKHIRIGFLERSRDFGQEEIYRNSFDGPENTLARGKCPFLAFMQDVLTKIASHIIKPETLNRLFYKATMNDLTLKDRSDINLWAKIDKFTRQGLEQIQLLRLLDYNEPRMSPPTSPSPALHRTCLCSFDLTSGQATSVTAVS